jgi:uracil-DNA glycosylase
MNEALDSLIAYFRQQAQLDMPSYVFSDAFSLPRWVAGSDRAAAPRSSAARPAAQPAAGARRPASAGRGSKPAAMPLPAHRLKHAANAGQSAPAAPAAPAPSQSPRRAKLAELFYETKTCQKCPLGNLRNSFVFGTGNADALFMVIGEAPGEEEDRQGLPFVGAAGELLTKMLAAISIDRAKQAFISNVVKCRPPGNRNPEPAEVLACADVLARQIEIIEPKVLLLLGKVAAHALLDSTETVAGLRERNGKHFYKGIPAFVTYHPAALLRNDSYRRPAWEDLQKVQKALKEATIYDAPAT